MTEAAGMGDGRSLEKKRVRLASIGVGMIGRVHAAIAARLDDCVLAAICDEDPAKAELARALGAAYYNDYRAMIREEKLDGVVIALPNELHEPVGSACADRGLHVFMEKPIAPSLEAADRLISSARRNGVHLLVAHHRRFNPMVVATREMIRRGDLGDVVGISVLWCVFKPSEYFLAGPWRRQKGGGPILINMIHEIDDLRYIYGEIDRVYAEVSNRTRGFEVEDTVSVSLRFRDGALGSILMSDAAPSLWSYDSTMGENPLFFPTSGNTYHFLGTKASLTFPGMRKVHYADEGKTGWQHPVTSTQLDIKSGDPYPEQLRHFVKVIRGEEEPRTSGEDARRTLAVTMAVHESGHSGTPVNV